MGHLITDDTAESNVLGALQIGVMVVQWASDFAAAAIARSDTVQLQSCQETGCGHGFRLIVSGDSHPGVFPAEWVPACFRREVIRDMAEDSTSGGGDDDSHDSPQALRGNSDKDVSLQDASWQDASLQDGSLDDVCTEGASSDSESVSDRSSDGASEQDATLQHSGAGAVSNKQAAVENRAILGRETEAALKVLRRGGHVAVVGGTIRLL